MGSFSFYDNIFECLPLVYYFWYRMPPAEGVIFIFYTGFCVPEYLMLHYHFKKTPGASIQ
jgi:hypothetical protein